MSDLLVTARLGEVGIVSQERDYTVGVYQINNVSIEQGLSRAAVMLGRASWTNEASVVNARFELSLDGGATWSPDPSGESPWPWGDFPISFSAKGGSTLDKSGNPKPSSGFVTNIPEPANPNRRVRGEITVSGATARFPITVEVI